MRYGTTVVDNYFWLREKSNPEVIKYLEQENAYTEAMTRRLKPFEDALYNEMLSHIKQTDLSVPVRRGDYYYYSRTEEGKQYPIQCRKKGSLEGKEEVLLDLNELGQGRKFVGLGAFVVSDDQNLLAYTIDYVGYRQYQPLRQGPEDRRYATGYHGTRRQRCLGRRQPHPVSNHRGRGDQTREPRMAPYAGREDDSNLCMKRRMRPSGPRGNEDAG